jgi:hypothetical protein
MNVTSHQPSFLPWVGFWNKIFAADMFIAMAGVDYVRSNYQNRVKLNGSWLTLPTTAATHRHPIREVELVSLQSLRDAGHRIEHTLCTRRFKYGHRIEEVVEALKRLQTTNLSGVNMALFDCVASILKIRRVVVYDPLSPDTVLGKTERLVAQIKRNCQDPVYFCGAGAAEGYLDMAEVPFPVRVQRVREGLCDETILKVIVSEPDPLDYVATAATWEVV